MPSVLDARGGTQPVHPGSNGSRGRVAEIQRRRLLSAVTDTVHEVGYARTTVAQIIARAGVSRKTFYLAFVDREDCFLGAFEQAIEDAGAFAAEGYGGEDGWREGVRAGLGRILRLIEQEPVLARLCLLEALGAGERVLRRRSAALAELASVIERGRDLSTPGSAVSELTAEGVIGAVFAVLHRRLLEGRGRPLDDLLGPLMSMIVLPYLGPTTASRELTRTAPRGGSLAGSARTARNPADNPLNGLEIRLTYRTMRVLAVVGGGPGASNREIAGRSGIADQGQMSRLLNRLERLGLVFNRGGGQPRGTANAWHLSDRGERLEQAIRGR